MSDTKPEPLPLISFQMTALVWVDARSEADAMDLLGGLFLPHDDGELCAVYSDNAIVTGLEIDRVEADGLSRQYDSDFLPLPLA